MADPIFDDIYREGRWKWNESFSGVGSELAPTKNLIKFLPHILMERGVRKIADLGCGDFFWMQHVAFNSGISYFGGDSVEELIKTNQEKFGSDQYTFAVHDIINDPIPEVDLVLVRDVFFHLKIDDIKLALSNIKSSGARYLLATTHDSKDELDKYYEEAVNCEIIPGEFRPVDLTIEPFNLGEPEAVYEEAEVGKYLALWEINPWED